VYISYFYKFYIPIILHVLLSIDILLNLSIPSEINYMATLHVRRTFVLNRIVFWVFFGGSEVSYFLILSILNHSAKKVLRSQSFDSWGDNANIFIFKCVFFLLLKEINNNVRNRRQTDRINCIVTAFTFGLQYGSKVDT